VTPEGKKGVICVINMRIKIHKSLPHELKRIENFEILKNKLKSYLL
jgi:hypothetical protein